MPEGAVEHPLEPGTDVYHVNQEWAATLPGGTATVVEAHGPAADGSWVYEVIACTDFARPPSDDNPPVRPARWSGAALRLACPYDVGDAVSGAGVEGLGVLLAGLSRLSPEERQRLNDEAEFAEISWRLELDRQPPQEGEW